MDIKETSRIIDNVKLELFNSRGELIDVREIHNTVTTAGKNGAADQILASPSLVKPGWMEVGTGTPSATLLGAYIAGSRTAMNAPKTRSNNIVSMVTVFAAGVGTGAITEAGTFDVVTENTVNMWTSSSFSVINKGALDSLTITWTLTFA
jgi:hypothetical protein